MIFDTFLSPILPGFMVSLVIYELVKKSERASKDVLQYAAVAYRIMDWILGIFDTRDREREGLC